MCFTGNQNSNTETNNLNTGTPESSAVVVVDYPEEGNIYKYINTSLYYK